MKAQAVFSKLAQGMQLGIPKTEVERVMTHYNVTRTKALEMIQKGEAELPLRGTGLL